MWTSVASSIPTSLHPSYALLPKRSKVLNASFARYDRNLQLYFVDRIMGNWNKTMGFTLKKALSTTASTASESSIQQTSASTSVLLSHEEAIWLTEIGLLECYYLGLPLTVQEMYALMCSNHSLALYPWISPGNSMDSYVVYRHYKTHGYIIVRGHEYNLAILTPPSLDTASAIDSTDSVTFLSRVGVNHDTNPSELNKDDPMGEKEIAPATNLKDSSNSPDTTSNDPTPVAASSYLPIDVFHIWSNSRVSAYKRRGAQFMDSIVLLAKDDQEGSRSQDLVTRLVESVNIWDEIFQIVSPTQLGPLIDLKDSLIQNTLNLNIGIEVATVLGWEIDICGLHSYSSSELLPNHETMQLKSEIVR